MSCRTAKAAWCLLLASLAIALATPAVAGNTSRQADKSGSAAEASDLRSLQSQLDAYRKQVEEQQKLVAQQAATLRALQSSLRQQKDRISALEAEQAKAGKGRAHLASPTSQTPQQTAAASAPTPTAKPAAPPAPTKPASATAQAEAQNTEAPPSTPVGQAPTEAPPRPQVQALSDLGGVLTPRGHLTLEPSIEFDHVSTNQLIFRGISIVQGLLIGVIDASDIRGDTTIASLTGRYGITNRLEVEAKIPYLYRQNHETDIPATSNAHPFQSYTSGYGIGDVELAAHYQFNSGRDQWPIFVGNFRYKSDTGRGPFDVAFDKSNGAPLALPTGSGFNAIEPSLTVIYPSDPVVFFGSVEYDYSFARNFNKVVSNTCGPQNNQPCVLGEVTPGQSVGATLGMSIALNEATSLTLGYQHYYIGGTTVMLGTTRSTTNALQVGSLLVGASYRFGPHVGINFTTQIGATRDSPDVRVMFKVPISLNLFGG